MKDILAKSITNLVNELHFPDRPLSVGDTCSQQFPFNIPVPGLNMQMNIKAVYKLVSIDNNIASFDVIESLDMNMNTEQGGKTITLNGNGSGDGKLLYDTRQNMPTSTNINFKMSYKMLMGDMTMTGDASIITSHITTVVK
jgi:hypothetical protein